MRYYYYYCCCVWCKQVTSAVRLSWLTAAVSGLCWKQVALLMRARTERFNCESAPRSQWRCSCGDKSTPQRTNCAGRKHSYRLLAKPCSLTSRYGPAAVCRYDHWFLRRMYSINSSNCQLACLLVMPSSVDGYPIWPPFHITAVSEVNNHIS